MQFSAQNNADKPTNSAIGKPMDRTDGRLKVTGAARYAAEFPMENLAHAVVVRSTIARGRIQSIDTSAAEKSAGVLAVITHLNAPKLATTDPPKSAIATSK
jgi:xanthine dehydrogenase YagR molybdenum-binding subunit